MSRAYIFLTTVALLGVFYVAKILSPPPMAAFSATTPEPGIFLDQVPTDTMVRMKLNAATSGHPVDVGLFGNSRTIMVGKQHLGLQQCTFFNYAIPGTSLRNSIAMLEILTANRSAPKLAAISLDHLEIGMMGHPEYLPANSMLTLIARDIAAPRITPLNRLRVVWRHAYVSWQKLKRLLASSYANLIFNHATQKPLQAGSTYRPDGSRVLHQGPHSAEQTQAFGFQPTPSGQVIESVFKNDLARLAALIDHEHGPNKIILYESPIDPANAIRYRDQPTPIAKRHRRIALEECTRLKITCRLGGAYHELLGNDHSWQDASHPPAPALGAFVRNLVTDQGDCGSASN